MFNFFSCCDFFFPKLQTNALQIQKHQGLISEEKKSQIEKDSIKNKKGLKIQPLNLNFFSKHIIDDILSPCLVKLEDFEIEKVFKI